MLDANGELALTRSRHLASMKSFAAHAFDEIFRKSGQQKRWFPALATESDNCIAAINWGLTKGTDAASAAEIANSLFHYWCATRNFELAESLTAEIANQLPHADLMRVQMLTLQGVAKVSLGNSDGIRYVLEAQRLANQFHPVVNRFVVWLAECAYKLVITTSLTQSTYRWWITCARKT